MATERDLARIQAAVARKRHPMHGATEIALAVGAVIDKHKMRKHFHLDIADTNFSFTRKADAIAAEAATDGLYVIRTSLAQAALGDEDTVRSYKSLALVERAFRCIKTIDLPGPPGASLAGGAGPRACVPVHAGLLPGMAYAPETGAAVVR